MYGRRSRTRSSRLTPTRSSASRPDRRLVLNQPIEDVAMRAELRDHLELNGFAQLVLRIGVGAHVPPTPGGTCAT